MQKRVGFVGIIVGDRRRSAEHINRILSEFSGIIIGRMGIPYPARQCSVITLIIDATSDQVGELTGRLGMLDGVLVKSALSRKGDPP